MVAPRICWNDWRQHECEDRNQQGRVHWLQDVREGVLRGRPAVGQGEEEAHSCVPAGLRLVLRL